MDTQLAAALDALYQAVQKCDYEDAQKWIDTSFDRGATTPQVINAVEFAVHTTPGGLMDIDELRLKPRR